MSCVLTWIRRKKIVWKCHKIFRKFKHILTWNQLQFTKTQKDHIVFFVNNSPWDEAKLQFFQKPYFLYTKSSQILCRLRISMLTGSVLGLSVVILLSLTVPKMLIFKFCLKLLSRRKKWLISNRHNFRCVEHFIFKIWTYVGNILKIYKHQKKFEIFFPGGNYQQK